MYEHIILENVAENIFPKLKKMGVSIIHVQMKSLYAIKLWPIFHIPTCAGTFCSVLIRLIEGCQTVHTGHGQWFVRKKATKQASTEQKMIY